MGERLERALVEALAEQPNPAVAHPPNIPAPWDLVVLFGQLVAELHRTGVSAEAGPFPGDLLGWE